MRVEKVWRSASEVLLSLTVTSKQRIRLAIFANALSPNYNRAPRPVLVAATVKCGASFFANVEPYSKIVRTPSKRIALTESEVLALRLAAFVAGY